MHNLDPALDEVRLMEASEATPELRAAVEAVCVLLDLKADFTSAQSRIMRSPTALTRRLLNFKRDQIPKAAAHRLRRTSGRWAQSEGLARAASR